MFNFFHKKANCNPTLPTQAYIFIGRSGCGKGTQADLLIAHLKENDCEHETLHLETGKLLRAYKEGKTYSAQKCNEIYAVGGLMPEFLVVNMWSEFVMKNLTNEKNIVFDGCPRKVHEAQVLDSAFDFYNIKKINVFFMNVSREWSEARMLARKRADDNVTDIKARLDWYDTDVKPTVEWYRSNPRYNFLDINGEQSIELVKKEILAKLGV